MNPLSSRLAARVGQRQDRAVAHADAIGSACDRAARRLWAELLRVLAAGGPLVQLRALAVLRALPLVLAGTLRQSLAGVVEWSHRQAAADLVRTLPVGYLRAAALRRRGLREGRNVLLCERVCEGMEGSAEVSCQEGVQLLLEAAVGSGRRTLREDLRSVVQHVPGVREHDWVRVLPCDDPRTAQEVRRRVREDREGVFAQAQGSVSRECHVRRQVGAGLSERADIQQGRATHDSGGGHLLLEAGLLTLTPPHDHGPGDILEADDEDLTAAEQRRLFASLLFPPPDEQKVRTWLDSLFPRSEWQGLQTAAGHRQSAETLAGQVAVGIAQGKSNQEVAQDLLPYVEGSRVRARRAARTLGLYVSNRVQHETHEQLGEMVVGYQVIDPGGPTAREDHMRRSGTRYWRHPKPGQYGFEVMPSPPWDTGKGPNEDQGGLRHNCRCYLAPILDIEADWA